MIIRTYFPDAMKPLSRTAAAVALGVDKRIVGNAITSGLLHDLTPGSVSAAASIPLLHSLQTDGGVYVPTLRLGEQMPSGDPDRPFKGYHVSMTDDEVLAASDRWWPVSHIALDAGCYLVVRASYIVAWLDVAGIEATTIVEGRTKVHYDAELVAIRRTDGTVDVLTPRSPNATDAARVVGLRRLGGGGGSFTLAEPIGTEMRNGHLS